MLKDYSLHNLSVIASRVSRDYYREDGEKEAEGDDHLADCKLRFGSCVGQSRKMGSNGPRNIVSYLHLNTSKDDSAAGI